MQKQKTAKKLMSFMHTMKKRILTLAMTLAMILALIPIMVTGATGAVTLSIPKTQYAEGERIWVTVTGITQEMINNNNWIAVYTVGGDTSMYHDWKYVKTVGTEIIPLDLPKTLGTYEIRFVPQFQASHGHSAVSSTFSTVANPPVTDDIGNYLWAGEWNTFWGKMTIRQNGASVEGEYESHNGRFEGTVHGNTIVGKWAEEPSYLPPREAGLIRMWMSEGGNMMSVGYSNGFDHPSSWNQRSGAARLTALEAVPKAPAVNDTPSVNIGNATVFHAAAIDSGVAVSWNGFSGSPLGYRVFRSAAQGEKGISITDFAIKNTTSVVDVNVEPDTLYYYALYAISKEATASGDPEQLSLISEVVSVKTKSAILGDSPSILSGGKTKNVILMQLDDEYMTINNGSPKLVDPDEKGNSRGTKPILINGRTMVPIRSVIEAMNGTVGWDAATEKITLEANGHSVQMWLNSKDLVVDGEGKAMDVAAQSVNGRTMVPVRFAAENVGCTVEWIDSTKQIVIVFYA